MARIGIDARFYGPIGKGLGRYTQKLIENLEKIDPVNEYYIFLRKINYDDYTPKSSNFHKVRADYCWYTFSEQLNFPRLLNKYNLDLMHFPHFNVPIFYRRRFLVTIHDLILIHFPTVRSSTLSPIFYWIKFLAYKIVIRSALKRSKKIITVSNFTRGDILGVYKDINEKKVAVTYEAVEDYCMMSPGKDEEILGRYGIMKPYIMYVGNAYPHKNLERLLLAYKKAKENFPDLTLVLVGNQDYFYRRLEDYCQEEKIEGALFLGYVPDHILDIVFHNARAFVWPSLYEGFGLPPLEAMAKGTPVISSDHACMKEILQDSAHFFDATDENLISEAIRLIMVDENLRKTLIKKGYQQTEKYSWRRMARQTLEIYESAKK